MAAVVFGLSAVSARQATAASCVNDVDCPELTCGGQICDWFTKGLTCQPAGAPGIEKGHDGWCTSPDDCKCKALGATCVSNQCTFTLPSQAPGATSTGGAPGSAGGSPGNTGGAGGSTSAGGSTGNDAGTPPKDSGGGGCTVAGDRASPLAAAWLGLLGGFAFLRRRRGTRA